MVEEEIACFSTEKETALTIGVFDGVHLGHRHLLSHLINQARGKDLISGVITFRFHPQHVLQPQNHLPYLTSLKERIKLLETAGVEIVIPLTFSPELAQVSAEEFVSWIRKHLKMRLLIVGPDFALGRNREGNAARLRSIGAEASFSLEVVSPMLLEGEVISSTVIRQALMRGDITTAHKLLGRPFSLSGEIVHGAGRGRSLGFPTANLAVDATQLIPADGVYVTRAYVADKLFSSVTSIGPRLTFGSQERTVEVHLLDTQKDLYQQELRIEFLERLRHNRQFASAAELVTQIERDVEQARAILRMGG